MKNLYQPHVALSNYKKSKSKSCLRYSGKYLIKKYLIRQSSIFIEHKSGNKNFTKCSGQLRVFSLEIDIQHGLKYKIS